MIGIEKLDSELAVMRAEADFLHGIGQGTMLDTYADHIETAVKEFLESKKSYYCTNTECPMKKALKEMMGDK